MAENQTAALANFEQAAAPPSPPGSEKSSSAGETVAALDLGADLGAGAAAKDVDAGTMDATVDPDEATGHNSTRALVFVLISIALSLFLGSLDMTVVATALPTVARELSGLQDLSWVATAYMLTTAAPQALWGRISDLFGRRNVLLFSIFLFVAASAMCAAAPSMIVLIVGRAVQGLGGGALNTICFILVSELVSVRQRGIVQGSLQVVFAVSSIVGPLLGGLFSDSVGWRWIFWINLPIGAVAFFGIFFFLRLPNRRTEGVLYKLKNLDWFGSITITAGTVLLLMGLTFGGQPIYGWGSPATISCLAIGVLFYPLFGIAEWKAKEPMVPLHLFRVRNFAITSASSFILGIAMFAPTYFIPLWFQIVRESSATNAGLAFLPGFIMSTIAGFTCGVLTTKYGIVLPFYRVGFAILALGMGLDSLWTGTMPYWQQAILLGLTGLGFGMVIVTIMLIVQTAVDGHEIGPATTVVSFLQTLGGIMGLAVLNVIIASQLNSRLPPKLDVIAAQYGIPHAVMEYVVAATLGGRPTDTLHPVAEFLPPGSPAFIATVAAMQDSTVHAFYIIFLVIGCVSVIPVILSAFLKKPNLSGGTLAVMDGQVMIQKDEEVNLDGVAAAEAPVNEKSNQ